MKFKLAPEIKEVEVYGNYTLLVAFDDGKKVKFDVSPYLDHGYFKALAASQGVQGTG
ncbi:DUF2442 domain-containing protein [Piscirickettsia salmonis]|uniref:DUF2442 domain-containing protein n=1 Tax=Piscirickettsia salmonis TaxID=1238 RepID=UPI0007D8539C|nr:hypothetical protein A0O36_02832 [Piscirickettsiaceae bacterium NZ-RLO1]